MDIINSNMTCSIVKKFVLILLYNVCRCTARICYQGSYYDHYDDDYSYYSSRIYCSTSCCGYYYYRYCCYTMGGGAIAGIVIGCLFSIALIVSLVVCLCCLAKRRQATQGVVYHQGQGQHVTYIAQTSQGQQFAHYPQYPVEAGGHLNQAYSQENVSNAQPPPGYHEAVRNS